MWNGQSYARLPNDNTTANTPTSHPHSTTSSRNNHQAHLDAISALTSISAAAAAAAAAANGFPPSAVSAFHHHHHHPYHPAMTSSSPYGILPIGHSAEYRGDSSVTSLGGGSAANNHYSHHHHPAAVLYGGGTNGSYDDRTDIPPPPSGIVPRNTDEYEAAAAATYPYHHTPAAAAVLASAGPHYAATAILYGNGPEENHFSEDDDEEHKDPEEQELIPPPTTILVHPHERGKPMALQQAIVSSGSSSIGTTSNFLSFVPTTNAVVVPAAAPRGKPEAMARAMALNGTASPEDNDDDDDDGHDDDPEPVPKSPVKKKLAAKKPKSSPTPKQRKPKKSEGPRSEYTLGEPVPHITEDEYLNLEDMMKEFCKVPLLAEFRQPVAVLHPEISKTYNSIISQPVDLGHVCRGIRQRKYKNLRDVRLDLWLVFGNCVKYNSHPNNKDAVPSFVSIALHLREYLNNLWQEFMMPSDLILQGSAEVREVSKAAFVGRARDRKRRIESSGVLIVSRDYVDRITENLVQMVENGGRVDRLDQTSVFSDTNNVELAEIIQRINDYKEKLQDFVQTEDSGDMQLEALYDDLKRTCFGDDMNILSETRSWVFGRLDRWFWKIATPLHEANCRGVAQSSIWGNIAACIWARESGKKPYWPALCLGILPPADQRETWHDAVTERNESRLPEKLRAQLQTAKKRCEQAQKRQSLSYFLVEFLGTHEFIWVKESDIVEEFDPEQDPNKSLKLAGKKGRPSRLTASAISDNKTYQKALQECLWANSEYENVLSDALKRDGETEQEDMDDSLSYCFSVLAQPDGERDDDIVDNMEYGFDDDALSTTDVDDLNYILTHNGLIDPDGLTRKGGKKKKPPPPKKIPVPKKEDAKTDTPLVPSKVVSSKTKPKAKDEPANDRTETKDSKESEKRRKKRTREREKTLLAEERKKRRRFGIEGIDLDDDEWNFDKRARATVVANAYMMRMKNKEDVKSFALSGVVGMPVASVDSIGLLGMTLAFRAAAGMLRMPDEGVDDELRRCPWKEISTVKVKSSTERAALLKKKLELMKNELERVQRNSHKRLEWIQICKSKSEAAIDRIDAADKLARQNPYKIKKKPTSVPKPKSPQPSKAAPLSPDTKSENSGDASNGEIPITEVEAVATHDTNDSSMPDEDESEVEVEAMVLDD